MDETVVQNKIVTADEWARARSELQVREDKFLSEQETLNRERQQLPMTPFGTDYSFDSGDREQTLLDLFDGRRQLIVYYFWFEPGDDEPCQGCSLWTTNLGDLSNLHGHDTSLVFVSRAPIEQIETCKRQRDWTVPWCSVDGEDFYTATGYADIAQITVFTRDDTNVYLTYITRGSDLINLTSHWTLLARTPSGS